MLELRKRIALLKVTTATLAFITLIMLAFSGYAYYNGDLAQPPFRVYQVGAGIIFQGYIGSEGFEGLRRVLEEEKPFRAATVLMNSGGGETDIADKMIKFIDENNLVFVPVDGSLCESACTNIFLETSRHASQDRAMFLFHSARYRVSALGKILLRIGIMAPPEKDPTLIVQERLVSTAPNLARFFSDCKVNPTTTEAGMYLSAIELKAILDGSFGKHCDDLRDHDADWAEKQIQQIDFRIFNNGMGRSR